MAKRKINTDWNKTIKRMTWIVVGFLAIILIISAVEKKEMSAATEVLINVEPLPDGNRLIEKEDIRLTIDRSFGFPMEGLPLSALNVERIERILQEDPFIQNADVFVDAENKINITVIQREPVLRIIDNNGLNYYLDKDGFKMPLSKHFSTSVLVASGNIPPHVPDFLERKKHILKDLFRLSEIIRKDEFLYALFEQIYVSNRGEFSFIPIIGRQKILFGRFKDVEDKFSRLKTFYQEALPYEGWRKYKTINLKYKGQVVCKK